MKKLFILLVLSGIFGQLSGQSKPVVLLSTNAAVCSLKADSTWDDWGDWIPYSVRVTVDLDSNKIIESDLSKETVFYIVAKSSTINQDGDAFVVYPCETDDATEVEIQLRVHKEGNLVRITEVYFWYPGKGRVYQVFRLA